MGFVVHAFLAACMLLALAPWHLASHSGGWLGALHAESMAVLRDPETQWMVLACLLVYLFVFIWLGGRTGADRFGGLRDPDSWLVLAVLLAALRYACSYPASSRSTAALTLLGAAALGKGMAARAERDQTAHGGGRDSVIKMVLAAFLTCLLADCLLGRQGDEGFGYHRQVRWTGGWENPNLYGLLMGVGMVVALGSAVGRLRGGIRTQRGLMADGKWQMGFYIVAALVMAVGLVGSFSRGAWVGVGLALTYLSWSAIVSGEANGFDAAWQYARRNGRWVALLLAALLVLGFWQMRNAEFLVARRAASVVNAKDFSWRNRVAAWEGALEMLAEKPWAGFGWGRSEPVYDSFYRQSKVVEGAAIQLNDYLGVATTLGVPALGCFAVYVWLCFARKAAMANGKWPKAPEEAWLRVACRAGVIVLLVGFWFDGGLFTLPTAAAFWILLELGRGAGANGLAN